MNSHRGSGGFHDPLKTVQGGPFILADPMRYSYAAEQEREEHVFADEEKLVESLRTGFWEAARKHSEEPQDDEWEVAPRAPRPAAPNAGSPVASAATVR